MKTNLKVTVLVLTTLVSHLVYADTMCSVTNETNGKNVFFLVSQASLNVKINTLADGEFQSTTVATIRSEIVNENVSGFSTLNLDIQDGPSRVRINADKRIHGENDENSSWFGFVRVSENLKKHVGLAAHLSTEVPVAVMCSSIEAPE